MKVLLTGADGYIGAIMGPKLIEAGHDVVGIDTGYYRRGWLFDDGKRASDRRLQGSAAHRGGRSRRLRGGGASVGAVQRPDRRERSRSHHADQPQGLGRPRHQGARRRGEALHLCLLLLDLWRGRRRDAHRDLRSRTPDRLCPLQDPGRAGRARADGRDLHAGLHAQRHRLRRLAPPAVRHRAEQSRRFRAYDEGNPHDQRRLALAADHPYRGYLRGDALRAESAARRGGGRGLQRRRGLRRTTASARSPRSSPGPSPAAR